MMNKEVRIKLAAIRQDHRVRVDPRSLAQFAKNSLPECFERRSWLLPESEELITAICCAILYLEDVRSLRRLQFWDHVLGSEQESMGPGPRALFSARKKLTADEASMEELMKAMDIASKAVLLMNSRFVNGRFDPSDLFEIDAPSSSEEDSEYREELDEEMRIELEFEKEERYARYKCAAMLPVLVEIADQLWSPLRLKIKAAIRSGGSYDR